MEAIFLGAMMTGLLWTTFVAAKRADGEKEKPLNHRYGQRIALSKL